MIRSILPILVLLSSSAARAADPEIPVLPETVVTGTAPVRTLDLPAADTIVLDRDDIARLGTGRLDTLLSTLAGVYLDVRGTPGSQADLHLRGSTAEGVLVLVNGVPMNDPQTAHFTLDLPVALSSVERIEVMGGGSSRFGPAVGGVVNIVTGAAPGPVTVEIGAGSHGSVSLDAGLTRSGGRGRTTIRVNGGRSDGYRAGTEFRTAAFNLDGDAARGRWRFGWLAGWQEKTFGAADFYAPYPSVEETGTLMGTITGARILGPDRMLSFRAGARGHSDEFILIRGRPDFYRNTHYSRHLNGALEYSAAVVGGRLLAGVEASRIGISSGSLGAHGEAAGAVYGSFDVPSAGGTVHTALRADRTPTGETVLSPGAGFTMPVGGAVRLRVLGEHSFREPTYTERFYRDPANLGDPALAAERWRSIEAGADISFPGGNAAVTLYYRRGADVLDWVRAAEDTVWQAANHGTVTVRGFEARERFSLWRSAALTVHSGILDWEVRRRAGTVSKYALRVPDRTLSVTLASPLGRGVDGSIRARYDRIPDGGDRSPIAVSLSRRVGPSEVCLECENVFNERYEMLPGLPTPGRWLTLRVTVTR